MAQTAQEIKDKYHQWKKLNPKAVRALERKAIQIHSKRGHVSSKYLIEYIRYEFEESLTGLSDEEYKVSNEFTPLIARDLKEKYPYLNLQIRPSQFD